MRKQKSDSYSLLLDVCSALLKAGGGLLLVYIGFIGLIALFVGPLFFSFGIKDKQVEILVGSEGMASKSKQSESKQYVGSMNRAQQAYFVENGTFSTSIEALGLGIKTETNNYKYSLRTTQIAAFHYAVAKDKTLKNHVGGVFLVPAKELEPSGSRGTVSILCKMDDRPLIRFKRTDEPDEPAEPIYQNGEVICGKGTIEVTR